MRILGIVASAFSAAVQKIYTWTNSFGIGVSGTNQNIAGFHGASTTYKYVFAGDQNAIRRYNFLDVGSTSVADTTTLSATKPGTCVASNSQTMIIGVGSDTTRTTSFFHSRTDTDGWVEIQDSAGISTSKKSGIWDSINNRFLFVGNTSGNDSRIITISGSGNTWSASGQSAITNVTVNDIGFNQSSSSPRYILVPIAASNSVYTSSSISGPWTASQVIASGTRSFRSIAYGNGVWVLTAANVTNYYTSTDNGLTWQTNTFGLGTSQPDQQSQIRFINNTFVVALRTSTSPYSMYIATSTDGTTWSYTSALSVTGITAAFSWSYAPADDVIFAATSDAVGALSGSLNIVKGA